MVLSSVDWALRGGIVVLVLLIAATLLRDHGKLLAARLAALFAVGTAAYAITSAAGFSPQLGLWTVPLLALSAGNNVVFWTLTAALFDDGFRLRWWHGALWLLLVVAGTAGCFLQSRTLGIGLTLSSLAIARPAKARELKVRPMPSVRDCRKQPAVPATTSSSHRAPCHQRRRKPSSNSEAVSVQKTTLLPADSASSGTVQRPSCSEKPADEVIA